MGRGRRIRLYLFKMKFIRLTLANAHPESGKFIYVNFYHIVSINLLKYEHTAIITSESDDPLIVKESPENIMAALNL